MNRVFIFAVGSALLLAGCAGEPAINAEPNVSPAPNPYLNTLGDKLSAWQQLAAERGETYRYVVSAGSVFGPSYNTTLTLQNGEVVARSLQTSEVDDTGNVTVTELWSETGSAVGSHEEYGATPLTVGERFENCRQTLVAADLGADDVYLEFIAPVAAGDAHRDGPVLSSCLVLPKNVVYDGGAEVVTELEFLTN